jgi:acyl-coenzyme A thioesterase PaaI-like protein
LGTLVDCHGNWTAAVSIMDARALGHDPVAPEKDPAASAGLPSTVTATYTVKLLRPTPAGVELEITSRVTSLDAEAGRADVEVEVRAMGKLTVSGSGTFVEVPEGHPAHHRWS